MRWSEWAPDISTLSYRGWATTAKTRCSVVESHFSQSCGRSCFPELRQARTFAWPAQPKHPRIFLGADSTTERAFAICPIPFGVIPARGNYRRQPRLWRSQTCQRICQYLGVDLVNIDKQRDLKTGAVTVTGIHGSVEGRTVILFEDCIVAGGTVIETAKILKEKRRQTSSLFSNPWDFLSKTAKKEFRLLDVDSVVITNSIEHDHLAAKISKISVAPLFAESLRQWM